MIRATKDFVVCESATYDDLSLGRTYLDRGSIVGYAVVPEPPKPIPPRKDFLGDSSQQRPARILKFSDYYPTYHKENHDKTRSNTRKDTTKTGT